MINIKQQLAAALLTVAVWIQFSGCTASCIPAALYPMTAYAAETDVLTGSCGEALTWTYDRTSKTLTVSGEGPMQNYEKLNEAPWSPYSDEISALKIEEGVTSIGYLSFMYLEQLTEVVIPEGVTYIGGNAFFGCSALREISLPESVSFIGGWAFDYTAWVEAKRAENPFVIVNGILIDGQSCTGAVVIPEQVSEIGDAAFTNNSKITAVTIPESVTSIGGNAFARCTALKEVTFPESLHYIGGWAFDSTVWLKEQRKVSPLVIFNQMLIDGQTCTGEVVIPEGIRLICGGAFETSSLTAVTIPESTEIIDYRVFSECRKLTAVTIPENVKEIGMHAFRECSKLTDITIPESVTEIGTEVFLYCCAENFTISGYAGSRAESYAAENHIPFRVLERKGTGLPGDVNEDGVTDVSDAVILARFAAEDAGAVISAQGKKNADCNKNGKPDPEDVVLILKAIAKLITL